MYEYILINVAKTFKYFKIFKNIPRNVEKFRIQINWNLNYLIIYF